MYYTILLSIYDYLHTHYSLQLQCWMRGQRQWSSFPVDRQEMTIHEDGVIANGEAPIDMTPRHWDMHKLMVDKGFEKLTAAELEVRKLEQSKLFPSSTSSTVHQRDK
jgi:hypothetical protein